MITLESVIEKLSDDELKESFQEIVQWRDTGVLKADGIVRNVHQQYLDESNLTFPMYAMESPILFEIAKRHYQ